MAIIESVPVSLARESLVSYLSKREILATPQDAGAELSGQAGAFVSLKKDGELRGCIGTFAPTRESIAEEIIHNAVSAATKDPRFWPVELDELDEINISVDILSEPEQVSSFEELDPKVYGVIVRNGRRSGLLLPDLEGVESAEHQVAISMQKAGIRPDEKVELYRFRVTRYT